MPNFNTEIQHEGFTFVATVEHTGQYRPYGDTFRVYNIETTCLDKDIVIDMVKTFIAPNDKNVPVKEEWSKLEGPVNYFRGYYTIEKTSTGWKYTKCEPFTD